MIRDPSDGSVREPRKIEMPAPEPGIALPHAVGTTVSGLAPEVTERAQRLQRSREWLKNYYDRKGNGA